MESCLQGHHMQGISVEGNGVLMASSGLGLANMPFFAVIPLLCPELWAREPVLSNRPKEQLSSPIL